jgi:hypothetical protein
MYIRPSRNTINYIPILSATILLPNSIITTGPYWNVSNSPKIYNYWNLWSDQLMLLQQGSWPWWLRSKLTYKKSTTKRKLCQPTPFRLKSLQNPKTFEQRSFYTRIKKQQLLSYYFWYQTSYSLITYHQNHRITLNK